MIIVEELVGKHFSKVKRILKNEKFRVTNVDGNSFAITEDFVPERFNLWIVNDIVTKVNMG